MRFCWKQSMESTQVFLTNFIRNNTDAQTPFVVATRNQTNGIGSRQNSWDRVDCGLYLSCALSKSLLPKDLPMQSTSIYFGMILLEIFRYFCNNLWLKWPNDFYLGNSKVGGLITQNIREHIIFGVGLNIKSDNKHSLLHDKSTKVLSNDMHTHEMCNHISNDSEIILYQIISKILDFLSFNIVKFDFYNDVEYECDKAQCDIFLQNKMSWNFIFKKYKEEFFKSHLFYVNVNNNNINQKMLLKDSVLQDDGSIKIGDKILYSLR